MDHDVENVAAFDPLAAGDRLGGFHEEAAREDADALEDELFLPGEEVVAPVDRGAERLLPYDVLLAVAGQQAEAVLEPVEDLPGREGAAAGRGELDRERDAVEPPADLADNGRVGPSDHERGVDCEGALAEEPYRLVVSGFLRALRSVRGRNGETRGRPDRLSRKVQRLAARGENVQA